MYRQPASRFAEEITAPASARDVFNLLAQLMHMDYLHRIAQHSKNTVDKPTQRDLISQLRCQWAYNP